MKPLLLFLSFLVSPCVVLSHGVNESYHPFIEEGKVWRVAHLRNEIIPGDYWTESYYLGEDTIISDVRCKKMMHGDNQYAGAVHEEGMRVVFFAPGSQVESLLYDFGVKVGDVVEPLMGWSIDYDTYTCVATDVVTIQHGDENLRCIFLSSQDERAGDDPYSIFGIWIEGIGSTTGPVIDIPLIMTPISQTLIGCSVGEKEIYRSGLSQAVHAAMQEVEAIKSGVQTIQTHQVIIGNTIYYDLSGRYISVPSASSVSSVLPRGVYIRDGKKVVVK